ncbi:MAG: hypothetical protein IJ521_11085 [Schwartzia sp.]|nr:hypothetical protein [Schwartzia sp. (in: firmicutes)]
MAHRTLPEEGIAVLCSAIKTNEQTAEQAGSAVTQLSQAMRQGFQEIEDALNDFPTATPFSIPANASSWTLDSEEETDYKWHYDVTAEGVTAADVAIVTISRSGMEAARRCGLCPQNETLAGKIRLRAMSVPPSSIAAEYYVCPGKEEEEQQEEGE